MIPWLRADAPFPPLETALTEPNGLLAAGADLSLPRLQAAYQRGIFPWFNPGEPILWWSPNPRMVLFPAEFKCSRSLAKRLKQPHYEVRVDTAFSDVMRACAAPRSGQRGTWISPAMLAAYSAWHETGFVHSFETWAQAEDDSSPQLVGGLYGVALGKVFFGESMFSRQTDTSKMALAYLVAEVTARGFAMIDCQMSTPHLASLGAREISRADFSQHLQTWITPDTMQIPAGKWSLTVQPFNSIV